MTTAAITPPEGCREELFACPATADSAGADEVFPPLTGTAVLPATGSWRTALDVTAAVVRIDTGDDDDDDDSMISDEAESVVLGTGYVATEVEPPTTLLAVGVSPMLDVCALATTAVGAGVPVVMSVGPSWS